MTIKFEFECCPVNAPTKALYCDNCKCVIKGNDLLIDDKGRFTHVCGNPVSAKTVDELRKLEDKIKETFTKKANQKWRKSHE